MLFGIAACGSDDAGDDDQRGDKDNVGVTDQDQTGDGGDGLAGDGGGGDNGDGGDTGGGDESPSGISIVALSPTTQNQAAGRAVTTPPRVEVRDENGDPMPGQTVRFSVVGNIGTIAPTTDVVTDSSGQATLTSWTMGSSAVPHAVRASLPDDGSVTPVQFNATVRTNFNIELIYLSAVTASQRAAFEAAAARWSAVVVSDHQDFIYNRDQLDPRCGYVEGDMVQRTGDDLVIFAGVTDIPDTPEANVLANAGPCYNRNPGDGTTQIGIMNFDIDDIDDLEANGQFDETVLHEMGHVIGVGTYWTALGLIDNPSSPNCQAQNPGPGNPNVDTVFNGPMAFNAFNEIGGSASPDGVPADNSAMCGSADSHWRESVFTNELMSPSIAEDDVYLPLSIVTIASIADMSMYVVNVDAADPFSLLPALRFESDAPKREDWCVPLRPLASEGLTPVP